jgi:NifU-like protein involved in Fe-S cluster formation
MGAHVIGRPLAEFPQLERDLRAFLKGEGPAPAAPWEVLAIFAPAQAHKSRHASILLPFEAMAAVAQQALQYTAVQ